MRKYRPLIGITPGFDYKNNKMFLNKEYSNAINKCGGTAIIISLTGEHDILDNIISKCDGFLISGGPDIEAAYFGEDNLTYGGEISPYRDEMELYIARKAVDLNKPILGICRGVQVINIAMGGTIYQDIFTQIKDKEIIKHSQEAPVWYPIHTAIIEGNSKMRELFARTSINVNSFHHQAVKDVAPEFKVSSRTKDGIIESIEHKTNIFAIGVQWHPELMCEKDETHLSLFSELVNVSEKSGK